jgi:sugar phosphate isomerase/epimerase
MALNARGAAISMMLGIADYVSLGGSLEDVLNFAANLKVSVVELKSDRIDLLSAFARDEKAFEIRDLLNSYDFKYFVHSPSIDVNLASVNPIFRRASKKAVLKALSLAANLGAELFVSHVGRLSRDYPRKLVGKATNNAIDCLKTISQASNDLGMVFTIENDYKANDYVLAGHPEQIRLLVENVGCKLTFDLGHANTAGKIGDFTKLLDRFIVNVHLHDNNGRKDEHLPIGKGGIDFVGVFRKMKDWMARKPLTVECHSFEGLKESVDFMRKELSV